MTASSLAHKLLSLNGISSMYLYDRKVITNSIWAWNAESGPMNDSLSKKNNISNGGSFVFNRCQINASSETPWKNWWWCKNVERFSYFENVFIASGGSKMTVMARARIGQKRLWECGEVWCRKPFC